MESIFVFRFNLMPNVLECDPWAHGHLGGGLMPVLACWLQILISKGEDYNPEAFWGRKKGSLNKWKIFDTYVPTISELCTIQLGNIFQSWNRQLFYFIQRLCLIMSFLRYDPLVNTSYLILISCLFKEQRQRWVFIFVSERLFTILKYIVGSESIKFLF